MAIDIHDTQSSSVLVLTYHFGRKGCIHSFVHQFWSYLVSRLVQGFLWKPNERPNLSWAGGSPGRCRSAWLHHNAVFLAGVKLFSPKMLRSQPLFSAWQLRLMKSERVVQSRANACQPPTTGGGRLSAAPTHFVSSVHLPMAVMRSLGGRRHCQINIPMVGSSRS